MPHKMLLLLVIFSITTACFTCNNASAALGANDTIVDSKNITSEDLQRKRLIETNGMAGVICKAVTLVQSDIGKIGILMSIFAMGIAAYSGKVTVQQLISFVIGAGIFFGSFSILSLISPFSDVGEACGCKQNIAYGRNAKGGYARIDLKLNPDCTEK
jgi:type IV secretory pathway VirB2 component (pilin)